MPTIFYAVPLAAIISLSYSATRFELPSRIFSGAVSMFIRTLIGMAVLYAVLALLAW